MSPPPEGGLGLVTNRQGAIVFTADERRQCSIIAYGDVLWNALVVERESQSSMAMYIPSSEQFSEWSSRYWRRVSSHLRSH